MKFESQFALRTGRSVFEAGRRPYKAIYPACSFLTEDDSGVSGIPNGFRALALGGKLSLDTIEVLRNAVACRIGQSTTTERPIRTSGRRVQRRYYDPLEACPCLSQPDTSPSIILEKMIVFSMFIYSWSDHVESRGVLGLYFAARKYISKRVVAFKIMQQDESMCIIWLWLIAIDAWRTGSNDEFLATEGLELMQQFKSSFPGLSEDWSVIETITDDFFFTGAMKKFWRCHWAVSC
jgi:hypothetical protein